MAKHNTLELFLSLKHCVKELMLKECVRERDKNFMKKKSIS